METLWKIPNIPSRVVVSKRLHTPRDYLETIHLVHAQVDLVEDMEEEMVEEMVEDMEVEITAGIIVGIITVVNIKIIMGEIL